MEIRTSSEQESFLGRCKVCAKRLRKNEEHIEVFHDGTRHLVCCASCAQKFENHPLQYIMIE